MVGFNGTVGFLQADATQTKIRDKSKEPMRLWAHPVDGE